jgi:hypothetical protein
MEENLASQPAVDTEDIRKLIEDNRQTLEQSERLKEERKLRFEAAKRHLDHARLLLGMLASKKTVRRV